MRVHGHLALSPFPPSISLSLSLTVHIGDTRQIHSGGRLPRWHLSPSPLSLPCARPRARHLHRPYTPAPLAPFFDTLGRLGDLRAVPPSVPPCSRLRRSHVRAGEPSSDEAAQGCALRAALPAACSPTAARQSPPAPVLADLNKHPVEGFSAGLVDEGNVFEWEIMIMGPPDTHSCAAPKWSPRQRRSLCLSCSLALACPLSLSLSPHPCAMLLLVRAVRADSSKPA